MGTRWSATTRLGSAGLIETVFNSKGADHLVRLRALGPAERRALLASAAWMPFFWLGLRTLGLARFHARLRRSRAATHDAMTLRDIRTLGDLVNVAARHTLFPASCLTRSLLLEWLLHRRGVPSQLRIGVRFSRGALAAHAWVECEGVPVNDRLDVANQFTPFANLIPAAAFRRR
jgi:hypothetical protein